MKLQPELYLTFLKELHELSRISCTSVQLFELFRKHDIEMSIRETLVKEKLIREVPGLVKMYSWNTITPTIHMAIKLDERHSSRKPARNVPEPGTIKPCAECGKDMKVVTNQKYCSEACKEHAKEKRTHTHTCEECGKGYNGRHNSKYCSKRCRFRVYHRKSKEAEERSFYLRACKWFRKLRRKIASWFK